MPVSHEAVAYMIHHVVLPPRLPNEDDSNPDHEHALVGLVLDSLTDLSESCGDADVEVVVSAIDAIKTFVRCRNKTNGHVEQSPLKWSLAELASGIDNTIILEIRQQNAGIVVYPCEDGIVFEFFELAPTNEAAMCKGRLVRVFPAFASKIPASLAQDNDLQKTLAETIARMSSEKVPQFQTSSTRNTLRPDLVTDLLMNVTAAFGETIDVARIRKHTREDVIFEGSRTPWRRSPLWLLIRVAIQSLFSRKRKSKQVPDELYKAFILLVLSRIIELVCDILFQPELYIWLCHLLTFH
ncbi:hypothetical protein J1614_009292 [Plenodomus biglobosus]|nr:hypothetical protein J1614_009292 [Plenodomus biglobosus]